MARNSVNAFVAYENHKEDNFEESSVELYQNKQNFKNVFFFQISYLASYLVLVSYLVKNKNSFFPGTYDEASLLLTLLGKYKDQDNLFSSYTFSPLLINKIKDWFYAKLTCSVLYYFLNQKIAKSNRNPVDWCLIGGLIQSPTTNY